MQAKAITTPTAKGCQFFGFSYFFDELWTYQLQYATRIRQQRVSHGALSFRGTFSYRLLEDEQEGEVGHILGLQCCIVEEQVVHMVWRMFVGEDIVVGEGSVALGMVGEHILVEQEGIALVEDTDVHSQVGIVVEDIPEEDTDLGEEGTEPQGESVTNTINHTMFRDCY